MLVSCIDYNTGNIVIAAYLFVHYIRESLPYHVYMQVYYKVKYISTYVHLAITPIILAVMVY